MRDTFRRYEKILINNTTSPRPHLLGPNPAPIKVNCRTPTDFNESRIRPQCENGCYSCSESSSCQLVWRYASCVLDSTELTNLWTQARFAQGTLLVPLLRFSSSSNLRDGRDHGPTGLVFPGFRKPWVRRDPSHLHPEPRSAGKAERKRFAELPCLQTCVLNKLSQE